MNHGIYDTPSLVLWDVHIHIVVSGCVGSEVVISRQAMLPLVFLGRWTNRSIACREMSTSDNTETDTPMLMCTSQNTRQRAGNERNSLKKIRTPLTHFRILLCLCSSIKFTSFNNCQITLTHWREFINERHKLVSPDTRFWQKKTKTFSSESLTVMLRWPVLRGSDL